MLYSKTAKMRKRGMKVAQQLFVDLYECDANIIDDLEAVKEIAHRILREIKSGIVEECSHKFEPIGITYIAVITTSHFSVHTWPEYGYAAVDIFSCDTNLPEILAEKLKNAFGAKRIKTRMFERDIEGRDLSGV